MSGQCSEKAPVTFCDVVASFSIEEWRLLHDWQKELYKNVMNEIQKALISLGPLIAASVFSLSTKEKEVPLLMETAGSEATDVVNHPSGDVKFASFLPSELTRQQKYCLLEQDICQKESRNSTSREYKDNGPILSFTIKEEADTECLDRPNFQARERMMNPADLEACYMDNIGIEVDENISSITTEGRRLNRKKEGGNTLKYDIQASGMSQEIEHLCIQSSEKRINTRNQPQSKVNPLLDEEDAMQCRSGNREHTFSDFYHQAIPNTEVSAKCNESENGFANSNPLSCHWSANASKTWYVSNECKIGFSKRSNVLGHQKSHFGAKLYQCSCCEKSFSLKEHLILHQRTHTEERLYHCNLCKLNFSQPEQLIAHQSTHERERPYECTKCEKRFTQKCSLTLHERTHTGEKPYQCNVCRKSFSQKGHLITHKRTHTGEKPYHCSVCTKSFNHKSNLTMHKRIHTGEKPFQCPKCQKSFNQMGTFYRHERAHARREQIMTKLEPIHEVHRPVID